MKNAPTILLQIFGCLFLPLGLFAFAEARGADAAETARPSNLIGYSEFRTNLAGGRWVNLATRRAFVVCADGTGRREIAHELVDEPYVWTHFCGWSPDGRTAIVSRSWNSPENGRWEEEQRTFRMTQWKVDCYLLDMASGRLFNPTAVDRISDINSSLAFAPDGKSLTFTALFDGVSKPYSMDLDGHNKRDMSDGAKGFVYAASISPDGERIAYHESYRLYVANRDGSQKRLVETGNPFNFGPQWSPDSQWLTFVSGERGRSNPYVVGRDGSGLRKMADLNGYQGWVLFLDVDDFHEGSSDVPAWGKEGSWLYYTAKTAEATTDIFRSRADGQREQLTHAAVGTLNYQPIPSPDGKWVCFGSKRAGTRQLYVMSADGKIEYAITNVAAGSGTQWPAWQSARPPEG